MSSDDYPTFFRILSILIVLAVFLGSELVSFGGIRFLGGLPGDIVFESSRGTLFLPLGSVVITSLFLTLIALIASPYQKK